MILLRAALGFFRRLIGGLALICAILSTVHAQEEPPKIRLRFLFLDETAGAYSIKTTDGYIPLSDTPYAISQPVTVSSKVPLQVFKEKPAQGDDKDSKPKRRKIAVVTIPGEITAALVVLTPVPSEDPARSPPYSISFIDDSPDAFPSKTIRVVNLTPSVTLATLFGTDPVLTEPGASHVVHPVIDTKNRVRTKVAIKTTPDGWEAIYDSILMLHPHERMTCVCVYSPSGMKHTYTALELAQYGNPPPRYVWLTYSDIL